jgi:hypothetical protein
MLLPPADDDETPKLDDPPKLAPDDDDMLYDEYDIFDFIIELVNENFIIFVLQFDFYNFLKTSDHFIDVFFLINKNNRLHPLIQYFLFNKMFEIPFCLVQ